MITYMTGDTYMKYSPIRSENQGEIKIFITFIQILLKGKKKLFSSMNQEDLLKIRVRRFSLFFRK